MNPINKIILIITTSVLAGLSIAPNVNAAEPFTIKSTNRSPLFDGQCDEDEWRTATKIELPTQIYLYIMHNRESLFVCAKGKPEDYTTIDLFIEHPKRVGFTNFTPRPN